MTLNPGDRVTLPGWRWRDEADRHGTIVECYEGKPCVSGAVKFVSVLFDGDAEPTRHFVAVGGRLRRAAVVAVPSASASLSSV